MFECVSHLCAVVAAVLDNPLHLLVNQLHTSQTGLLQTLDLTLDQQLERHLGHKQSRPRALSNTIKPSVFKKVPFKTEIAT